MGSGMELLIYMESMFVQIHSYLYTKQYLFQFFFNTFIFRPVSVTWTHLSETATKGSKILKLTQSVSWKAGDEIVIATTGK